MWHGMLLMKKELCLVGCKKIAFPYCPTPGFWLLKQRLWLGQIFLITLWEACRSVHRLGLWHCVWFMAIYACQVGSAISREGFVAPGTFTMFFEENTWEEKQLHPPRNMLPTRSWPPPAARPKRCADEVLVLSMGWHSHEQSFCLEWTWKRAGN